MTRVGASARGQRTSFKSLLILINRGDMSKRALSVLNKPQINGETKLSSAVADGTREMISFVSAL